MWDSHCSRALESSQWITPLDVPSTARSSKAFGLKFSSILFYFQSSPCIIRSPQVSRQISHWQRNCRDGSPLVVFYIQRGYRFLSSLVDIYLRLGFHCWLKCYSFFKFYWDRYFPCIRFVELIQGAATPTRLKGLCWSANNATVGRK